MIKQITYSEPVLCHHNFNLNKPWFVYFDVTNNDTGETIRKQFRSGINYFKTREQRLKTANSLLRFWVNELKDGWHPFDLTKKEKDLSRLPFTDALDFGLSKCAVSKKTYTGYKTTCEFVKAAATTLKLATVKLADIKRMHIKLILDECVRANNLSNVGYNKHLGYLKAVLSRCENYELIDINPAHKISNLPVVETEKFIPYTTEEKKAIQEYLFVNHYKFYVYLMVIYSTGIRPKEVLALKIKDIDLINSQITIYPDLQAENSKTKNIRKVPVSKPLQPFLRELGLSEYNREYYVFGSPYESGKGNKGSAVGGKSGAMHPDYFKPSLTKIKRDTVTKLWKKLIREGLKIDKYLYASKHTGGADMILAGIPLDTLKELFGHSSKLMTEKYAGVIKKVRFNEIIENSPSFTP